MIHIQLIKVKKEKRATEVINLLFTKTHTHIYEQAKIYLMQKCVYNNTSTVHTIFQIKNIQFFQNIKYSKIKFKTYDFYYLLHNL